MNSTYLIHIIRFIVLVLVQVLIFKRISVYWGGFTYIHFIIYPLFILLLPIKTPKTLVLALGFLIGIIIDIFYNSPGVHASACVLLAYIRGPVIKILEPYEGYNIDDSPTMKTMGFTWFITYLAICLFIFLLVYFSVEAFSFVYLFDILMDTIFSFIASYILLVLGQFIFRSRN